MSKNTTLLILGGTTESRALAQRISETGIKALYSYAGRTASPIPVPIPTRIGGFGGTEGLAEYLKDTGITHVVDATHPFAQTMSEQAAQACNETGTPMIALTRPAWTEGPEDIWTRVPDMDRAVATLSTESQRIFLAIGRQEVARFARYPQHYYLMRMVDVPDDPIPLPNHGILEARGPFTYEDDLALLDVHKIGLVISKNSGGDGARAKIDAARALGIPVLMIDRPKPPERRVVTSVDEVMEWLGHEVT